MSSIKNYFNFHLEKLYMSYPSQYLDDIGLAITQSQDILSEDIKFYPHYANFEWDETRLVDLIQLNVSLEAVILYRIENYLYRKFQDHPLLDYLANMMKIRSGAELYYSNTIGPGFRVLHSHGIVLGPKNNIGNCFSIYQNVTIGQKHSPDEITTIGDNVFLSPGSKVFGGINIGSNTVLGANSVLFKDADPDSVYVGAPARKVETKT